MAKDKRPYRYLVQRGGKTVLEGETTHPGRTLLKLLPELHAELPLEGRRHDLRKIVAALEARGYSAWVERAPDPELYDRDGRLRWNHGGTGELRENEERELVTWPEERRRPLNLDD